MFAELNGEFKTEDKVPLETENYGYESDSDLDDSDYGESDESFTEKSSTPGASSRSSKKVELCYLVGHRFGTDAFYKQQKSPDVEDKEILSESIVKLGLNADKCTYKVVIPDVAANTYVMLSSLMGCCIEWDSEY